MQGENFLAIEHRDASQSRCPFLGSSEILIIFWLHVNRIIESRRRRYG
jgi:hypothetical protein